MAAASSVVELCTLANAKLDAATSAKFFHDDDDGAEASSSSSSSSFSWPEAERASSRLTSQTALKAICEKYQVPADYIPISLDSRWVACRPPPEGSNAICVYAGALEAGMRIPLHDLYVAVLGHYGLAPSQLAPDAWRYMAAFVLLCKDAGVEPTLRAFRSFFSICTHKGDYVGWHHFSCRQYFESRSGVATGLFTTGKMPRSAGWQYRFFHLQSPSTTPWPCAVKWGKPSRAAVRLPEVTWDTDVKRLLERAGGSAIDVIEFLSRRSPPVVDPPQDALPRDRVRLTYAPQQKHKHKLMKLGAAAVASGPPSAPPQQLELARKRKSISDTHTHTWGLVDSIAEASELVKNTMAELDGKGKELRATREEVAHLKEQLRAVREKHAGDVAQLKEAVSVANDHHAAEVRRLADEHHKARTAHGEEVKAERASMVAKLQAEHAAAVARLTEHLNKEHAAAVAQLKEKHAAEVGRLEDDKAERAAEVAKLQDDVARLREEHAAEVARVKDAADKEVQDAKRNIVLRLFPKLDVSLLERPKLKGDLAADGTPRAQGDPDKTADRSAAS